MYRKSVMSWDTSDNTKIKRGQEEQIRHKEKETNHRMHLGVNEMSFKIDCSGKSYPHILPTYLYLARDPNIFKNLAMVVRRQCIGFFPPF